jgi:cobalt-zinc-cadmium efflux system outer membrane protein
MVMGRWLRACSFAGAGLTGSLGGCTGFDPADGPKPLAVETRHRPAPVRPAATRPPVAPRPEVTPVSWQQPGQPPRPVETPKLEVPARVPGADATLPDLPLDTPLTRPARLRAIEELFPDIADLRPDPVIDPTPDRPGVAVDQLIELAKKNSPLIAQAVADVEAAYGRWVQAGLYPNPTVGLQGDSIANLGSKGQLGYYFSQPIVTGGKLTIARSVAFFDYAIARVKLRRAEVDLTRQVRADYYAALVAAESVRLQRVASEFTHRVYLRQVASVRVGTALPFEAAALRAIYGQSEIALVQARNRYVSAWKQMAATLNAPDLPPGPLAGVVDQPAPRYHFAALRELMLARHTDLAVVSQQVAQAEYAVTQARRKVVPDVTYYNYFEHDNFVSSFQWGGQVGVTFPVFDRNQGNITAAKAQLMRLDREGERVRNDLSRQLADAYERYDTGREQLALYRDRILPDLVRAFRGVHRQYETEPDKVNYNDIVTAQQNLTTQLGNYLTALNQQWQATADLAGIVQADRLEELVIDPAGGGPDSWPQAGPQRAPAALPAPAPVPPKN